MMVPLLCTSTHWDGYCIEMGGVSRRGEPSFKVLMYPGSQPISPCATRLLVLPTHELLANRALILVRLTSSQLDQPVRPLMIEAGDAQHEWHEYTGR